MQHNLRRAWLMAGLILQVLATSATATAQDQPPRGEVTIGRVDYRGNGCKDGSAVYNISPDGKAMTVLFADYVVDSSARRGRPARKICDLDVQLNIPDGWSFSVFAVDVRGYASLQPGVVGVQKVFASFGRIQPQQIGRQRLVGPYDDNYVNHSEVGLEAAEWSRCNTGRTQKFNLKTAVTVRPQAGFNDEDGDNDGGTGTFPSGFMTIDSLDGRLVHVYGIAWKRCGAAAEPGDAARATCRLSAGAQRTFTESATGPRRVRAKDKARDKVLNTCRLALPAGQANQFCREERVQCEVSGVE